MKILVVEDEKDLNNIITKHLKKNNFSVDSVFDGEEALEYLNYGDYDVIILDVMMPKMNGYEVVKNLRANKNETAVLMLTARDGIDEKIKGLDLGADDYLVKPFDFSELKARIRALLRREFTSVPTIIKEGELCLDLATHKVTFNDQILNLTLKEYSILKYLIQNKGRIVSSEELIQHVWDENADPFTTVIRVHIYSLRKKLITISGKDNIIQTIKGVGYLFGGS